MNTSIISKIKRILARLYIHGYGVLHKTQKKVLFISFYGKQYSDNPRAISEKLHEIYPEFKIVWEINDNDNIDVPDYVTIISDSNLKLIRELSTCCCLITNFGIETWFYKKSNQMFIQTWHGDRGFKKILNDSRKDLPGHNETYRGDMYDSTSTDLCIAGSKFGEELYRTAFNYSGEILNVGCPRNDLLILGDDNKKSNIKKKIGISDNTKLLLYAPTYRDNSAKIQNINIDINQTLRHLQKKGDSWVCGVRAHAASHGINLKNSCVVDLNTYPDMADLLLIADMLITDYSSSAGDFALTDKPLILVHFDKQEYINECRTLYFEPNESGYIIAESQDELNNIIDTYTREDYIKSNKKVCEFYGVTETGYSSDAVCQKINDFYNINH